MNQSDKPKKDVIIVGTGIAGSLVAKLLTDHVYDMTKGKMVHRAEKKDTDIYRELSVLMYEAGLEAGVELDSSTSMSTYNEYLRTFYMQEAKVPNSPYPNLKQAPSPNILDMEKIVPPFPDKKGYLVQFGPMPFASDAIRVGGGTTLHWLGTTPRMLPNDFRMTKEYHLEGGEVNGKRRSLDWPLDYNTLKPYYEMAEYEIGVSGNVSKQEYPIKESMKEYYGENYVFPMEEIPQSYMDDLIVDQLKGMNVKLNFVNYPLLLMPTPQGRNSIPNPAYNKTIIKAQANENGYQLVFDTDGKIDYKALGAVWNPYMGERCEGNASCVPICPVQAKYNALKTLKKALYKTNENYNLVRNKNIEVQAQSVVYKLSVDQGNPEELKISKVHLRRYFSKHSTDFVEEVIDTTDSIVILASNAFENPKILLNSKYTVTGEDGRPVEKTVANSSDQVGRNLMDHLVMLTWGLFPKPVYPFRGPGSTTNISSFRDGEFRKEFSAWISPLDNWGWGWPAFSPGSDVQEFLGKGYFGKQLKDALADRLSRQVLFHFEVEQLPNPNNRVTINNEYLDVLGIPRPVINYEVTDYEKRAMEQAKLASDQMFAKLGVEDFTKYKESDMNTFVYNHVRYSYNGAGHIVGTHCMGSSSETSVTNSYCKAWDHPNLYIVGAGNMTTLGTSNPTLTLSALTIRSVESMLSDLERNFKTEKK